MSLVAFEPNRHIAALLVPLGFRVVGGSLSLPDETAALLGEWYVVEGPEWDLVKSLAERWTLYLNLTPDSPSNSVGVLSSGGNSPNPRWLLEYPAVQILINGDANSIAESRQIAELIKRRLLGIPSHNGEFGDRYVQCNMDGDIGYLGLDRNGRPQYSMNFTLIVEPIKRPGDHRDPI